VPLCWTPSWFDPSREACSHISARLVQPDGLARCVRRCADLARGPLNPTSPTKADGSLGWFSFEEMSGRCVSSAVVKQCLSIGPIARQSGSRIEGHFDLERTGSLVVGQRDLYVTTSYYLCG
jgi:hypothetical protein